KQGRGEGPLFLCGPDDWQLLRDTSEVRIAGDQRSFAKQGQGGCEAIDVRKLMVGFEFGGTAGKFDIGRNDGNRQLTDFCQDMVGVSRTLIAPDSIENLAPVHDAKQQLAFPSDGELDEFLD